MMGLMTSATSGTILQVSDLIHHYGGADHPAVNGISFTVNKGEIVGLLGANGAGKTTTLHILLGLLRPTSGTVKILGYSPISDRDRVMPLINFASVEADLPGNLILSEALGVYADLYGVANPKEAIQELIDTFELGGLMNQRIGTLSSGEQMRLKISKALLNHPELLILDEPTLSLDPYIAHKVRGILKEIQRRRGMAILHTSHNMAEVETFCDRILFIHKGKIMAEGTPRDVLTRFKSQSLNELFIRVSESGEMYEVENG